MRTIKEWREEERPREKLMAKGAEALTEAELLALLLRTGDRGKDAVQSAREILEAAGGTIHGLASLSLDKLQSLKGIGVAKSLTIIAAVEIGKRICQTEAPVLPRIYSSKTVADIMSPIMRGLRHEECWIMYLNRSNKLISKERVSSGGVCATVVDIKIIIKKAIEKLASGIIMLHNHPSGTPYPGENDKKQTKLLREAASLMDIDLIDHVIIAGEKYYSFKDEGLY
ncbi:MAG: DNA repair protein RadC [Bacteroidales bacterium]|nr:DNA repair protein RadC [Bacteroidales bacterium]